MKRSHLGMTVLATALSAPLALGAGFEKNITFSGKNAGKGGNAVADTKGAEATHFNPAGLGGTKGFEVSGNFSPTWGTFKGPMRSNLSTTGANLTFGGTTNLDAETGSTKLSPVFGALASYGITDKLGVGVGAFVSGGSKAYYDNQQMKGSTGSVNLTETTSIKTDLAIVEYALGLGYEVMPGLRVGASYRLVNVSGDFHALAGLGANTQAIIKLDGLSKSESGYKVGAQYEGSGWGVGATYRGATDFTAAGTLKVRQQSSNGAATGDATVSNAGAATLASTLPTQIVVGGFYDVMSSLRILAQYDFTEYGKNRQLKYTGAFTTISATAVNLASSPTQLDWANQSVYRLGGEYSGWSFAKVRAGYAYTSQVTNATKASAQLTPPGSANTFTLGMGKAFGQLEANAAFEYSKTTGSGAYTTPGDYEAAGVAAHLGATYRF